MHEVFEAVEVSLVPLLKIELAEPVQSVAHASQQRAHVPRTLRVIRRFSPPVTAAAARPATTAFDNCKRTWMNRQAQGSSRRR